MLINIQTFLYILSSCVVGLLLYQKVALKNRITSSPNSRTLHHGDKLTGGGIVFSLLFVFSVFYFWSAELLSNEIFLVLGIGGFFATLLGFIDDLFHISAPKKLAFHILLSSWSIYCLEIGVFSDIYWLPNLVFVGLSVLFLVWVINAYNFIDGIDGLAASGAFFISGGLIIVMILTNSASELIVLYFSLLACAVGFILFNWPPAKIFMGDSGSIFLGYIVGSIILVTIDRGEVSMWTWLVIFGYFFADTTITQIMRLVLVKKWYKPHRSHAYQNLARITGSHFKVASGIAIYHFVWLLPLMILSVKQPDLSIFAAALAVFPAMVFAVKFGPLASSS